VPNFRKRLTRAQQRAYDRSDAVASIRLRATPRVRRAVVALADCLPSGDRTRVEQLARVIAEEITTALGVPGVRVTVGATRPANARGELHGLYTSSNGSGAATITIWMITVKRRQVVAFKTFLRTLLHEICHHLDYALLHLPDSFHTDGFYKRESSLFHQLGGATATGTVDPARRGGAGIP
jgi:hypothetical protein